jgi:protein TonB
MRSPAPPLRQRAVTLTIVAVLHLLLIALLLRFSPDLLPPPKKDKGLATFDVQADRAVAPKRAPTISRERRASGGASRAAPKAPVPPPPKPPVVTTDAPSSDIWSKVIPLTRDQYAKTDVGKLPSQPAIGPPNGEGRRGSGVGAGEGDVAEGGGGPNGERLYDADWQRRPTNAELAAYLPPRGVPEGWGLIACRTVPGNRVEDCQELGQSPTGSGLARAVRQAAWQFRILPPRVGGRPLIGVWVRIRIDYTERGAAAR